MCLFNRVKLYFFRNAFFPDSANLSFFLRMAYSILFVWGLFRKGTKKAGLVETRPGPKLIVYEKKLNADKDGYQILKQDFDPGGRPKSLSDRCLLV